MPPDGPPIGASSVETPDDPAPANGRRRAALVVAGVFGVIALLVATVAFIGRDDGDPVGEPSASDQGTVPSAGDPGAPDTSEPADAPSEEEFLALVDELKTYVADARGLPFQEDVDVQLAGDEEFERRLAEKFEDSIGDIEDAEVFYRALGLLDAERSLLDTLREFYAAGVLGFYDSELDELVVRGTRTTPYVQQTILHELVHALDDQHFELHRPSYDDAKDEISLGFTATIEGNARRIENRWISEQPADFRAEANAEEESFAAGIDASLFPEILLFQIAAPYQLGEVFVGQRVVAGGERAVDAALTDPPETSEQVLFPPLFEERQPRVEVPVPPADGEIVDDGVVGALFLLGLFSTGDAPIGQSEAFRAVQGWGGDWAVTWTDGDVACVRADFVGDTPGDTDELESALTQWAEGREGPQISRVEERVRLDSCGAAAGSSPPQV